MVFAISNAWSLLSAKSCTPLCVVNDSTMMSGWFSGQPVANAVTKSADVDRFVIGQVLCGRDECGDFALHLGALTDQARDVKQCRGREVSSQRLAPGRADTGAAASYSLRLVKYQ